MKTPFLLNTVAAATVLGLTATSALAEEQASDDIETITIIGNSSNTLKVAGSAHVVTEEDLEEFKYSDVNRAMRQVPGVYIQLEDGLGLRPNIGLRGTGTSRTGRVSLMEDGVLIAPAPYAASSAYYFPTFDRITGIEVLKGPASIQYGPFTVGGAVNLISRQIPIEGQGQLKLEKGQHEELHGYFYYGDSFENFGYLVELNDHQTDGFKVIDRIGQDTGFEKRDQVVKLRFNTDSDASVYQQLDIKLQNSSEVSDQSYVGLTDADFGVDPYRMYGISAGDQFQGKHEQLVVSYYADLTESLDLHVTAYDNDFARNWYKTGKFYIEDSATPGTYNSVSWSSVIGEINTNPGSALANYYQSILDGADSGSDLIDKVDGNRSYMNRGVQARLDWNFTTGGAEHDLKLGLRAHEDDADRFQRRSYFTQENGQLVLSEAGIWGDAGNRIDSAEANSYYLIDTVSWGDWIFTPGVRYEDVELKREDWSSAPDREAQPSVRTNTVSEVLPGFGALWSINDTTSVLFGVNKGFAPPGSSADDQPEESWNYEMGLRFSGSQYNSELIAFFSDYDNLLGECTLANSGCDINNEGDKFNGGEAEVKGVELLVSGEFAENWPARFSYTFTETEFGSSFDSNVWGTVETGQPIPYIPENQAQLMLGYDNQTWSLLASINYMDELCTKPACGQFQKTEERTLVDLAAEYQVNDAVTFFATIENVTDEDTIVAREPYGARPDKPRTAKVGLKLNF
ncbi:TonB-dependent receptor family protein [Kangiella sediminilitoris]|uniref:TonB-dependent receptor n=1 Tax=Kangiella sediminilitoris TaxID=1144748 RepID=A0A1B3BCT1_9GAMM|nr:TonB-dependent receptor [Kangiella sediminilitoris]AOE50636.1 TonB-dependent receptor [Kangiella sediminilitoris]